MQQRKIERYIRSVIILLLLTSFVSFANEELPTKKSQIDATHDEISEIILNITEGIDDYFANGKFTELENESQLKLSMLMEVRESIHPAYEPDINFRMVLPRTQKRLQLVVEPSDSDKRSDTSDSQKDRRGNRDSNSTNAGLRYILDLTGMKFSTGTGIILGIPTKVFVRLTAKKDIKLSDWTFKIKEELYWVNTDGLSSDLDADFYYDINKNFEFKFVNNASWDEEDETIEFENGPSLFQTLSRTRGLSYHAHIFTLNKPEVAVSNYLLQVTYTQNIWKKWIFANFSPFINFPREEDFHRVPGFNIRVDALFGYF